jgi:predicted short-subunit dehydrogenase-like oxidoreductase (DUF2520 family)
VEIADAGRIGFVGPGRLAWSLAPALVRAGYAVTAVAGRDPASAAALANALGPGTRPFAAPQDVLEAAELVFLTVPDAMLGPLAGSLSWTPRHSAVHCSGALPLDALSAAAAVGAETGTLHPLQSFPSRLAEPNRFQHIYCGIEGTGALVARLDRIARSLGSRTLSLAGVNRALYHAAAVFASNDVVALMSAASRTWAIAGLPEAVAREALSPLLSATAANIASLDLTSALTGPVARGDTGTISAHLDALSATPELRDLYRRLASELLLVATQHDLSIKQELARLLSEGIEEG